MDDAERVGRLLLAGAGVEPGGHRPWDPHIHDDRFWARVLRDRELGLGETYQEGWWDVPALDTFIARVLEADLQRRIRTSPRLALLTARSRFPNRQSVRRARRNAEHHYNVGNDLFARMLDPRMVYSCAYWEGHDTLADAQEAKLELICRKLHLEPGMTLLDIGCGWGGLAVYAAQRHGVRVTGITPAAEQLRVATQRAAGLPVRILQQDYRRHTGRYDRVVSVGMFEHVGPRNHRAFFRACERLLTPDGLMLHHTILARRPLRHTDPWVDRYIFPGGVLPSLSQIARATEGPGPSRTCTTSARTTTAR